MGNISQKLTYLNGTKTKIREGLNSLGADLDTEDTFRSYVDAIDEIYEDYPKITGEGESLSLDNTKQASMQIDYKGNTSQTGTPTPSSPIPINVVSGDNEINVVGKNLLVPDTTTTRTSNGITSVINEDGSLTLTGTATANAYLKFTSDMTLESNTTYTTLNQNSILPNNVTMYYNSVGNIGSTYADTVISPGGRLKTYTTGEVNGTISIAILVQIGVTINTTLYPMLLKGTYTISNIPTYEPYQDNTYNIDLPVENLWGGFSNSLSRTDSGVQFTANQDGTITANGTATNVATSIILSEATSNGIYKTLQKGTYTVSGGGAKYSVEVYDKNNVVKLGGIPVNGSSVSFTINSETQVVLRIQVANGITINETIKLQLEKGSSANTYTSYGTTPIELCKIGDYQDYIYKDNGSWYLHKEIGKVVLNGTENWTMRAGNRVSIDLPSIDGYYVAEGLCDKFKYIGDWDTHLATNYSFIIRNGNWGTNLARISFIDTDYTTVTAWKQYVAENNITVYYQLLPKLGGATNTEITDTTLLEQLEESKLSYISQTNISQVNNDLPIILDVKALRGE